MKKVLYEIIIFVFLFFNSIYSQWIISGSGVNTAAGWYHHYDSLITTVNTANNPTITVQGTLDDSMYVDWGDGHNNTYVFTNLTQDISHTYTSVINTTVKFYGNLTTFNTYSDMDWTFNINQLNKFSGLQFFNIGGTNHITGNLSSIAVVNNLKAFKISGGSNDVGDDVGDLARLSNLQQFKLHGLNGVADYSFTTWTSTNFTFFDLEGTSSLSTVEVDQLIIDLDNDANFSSTLIITGNCQPRSSASNVAVNNIISRGGTVTTNPPPSNANNHYVDETNGNDNNDGSKSAPWKTLNKVKIEIAAGTIVSGDSILLKRNEIWNEPFEITDLNGAVDDTIVIGAYGTGNKPEITCEAELPNWQNTNSWTYNNNDAWTLDFGVDLNDKVRRLWINNVEEGQCWWDDSLNVDGDVVAFADAPGATAQWSNVVNSTFKWKGGGYSYRQIQVYSPSGNPASVFSSMKYYTSRTNMISITHSSYLVIQDIKTTGGNYSSLIILGGHDIEVKNNDFCNRSTASGVIVRVDASDPIIDAYNVKIHDNKMDSRYTRYDPYRYGNIQFGVEFDYGAHDCEVYQDSILNLIEAAFRVLSNTNLTPTPTHDISFHDNYINGYGNRYAVGANMQAQGSGTPVYPGDPTPYHIFIYRNVFDWTTKNSQYVLRDSYIHHNIWYDNWAHTAGDMVNHHDEGSPSFGHWESVDRLSKPLNLLQEGAGQGDSTCYFNNTQFRIGNFAILQNSSYYNSYFINNLFIGTNRELSSSSPHIWRWVLYFVNNNNNHTIEKNCIAPQDTSYNDEYIAYGYNQHGYPDYIFTVPDFNAMNGVEGDVILNNYLSKEVINVLIDSTNFSIPSSSSAKNSGVNITDFMTRFPNFKDINGNTVDLTTPNIGAIDNP